MITIQQCRAVIGSFTQKSSSSYMHDGSVVEYDDDAYVEYMHYESVVQYGDAYSILYIIICNCVMVLVNMGAFVTLSFIVAYLLSCGDIESNPGPGLYIVCPSCRGQVHVQKSVCSCGFIFKKKTRYGGYKMYPVGFATTTDQHSVASASMNINYSNATCVIK